MLRSKPLDDLPRTGALVPGLWVSSALVAARASELDSSHRRSAGPKALLAEPAVLHFSVIALVVLVFVTVGTTVASRRAGTDEAVGEARRVTEVLTRGVVEPVLTDEILTSRPEAVSAIDAVIRQRVLDDSLVRVKIWMPTGLIVYSDEPRLIGSVYPLRTGEREALRTGFADAEPTSLSEPENRFDRQMGRLVEVYLPTRTAGGHPVLVEMYYRYESLAARGRRIWQTFAPTTFGSLLVLEGVALTLAWSMARRLRQGQAERETLFLQAIDASEAERQRIASDLHDGVVQDLVGVSYSLAAVADTIGRNGSAALDLEATAATLAGAASDTRRSVRSLRSLLVEIHPPNLELVGLEAALSDLLQSVSSRGIKTSLDVAHGVALAGETEALAFRVAQEAVRNVVAHARSTSVHVSVATTDGSVVLSVSDDGVGFDLQVRSPAAKGHIGLRLLSDLVRQKGGSLEITSAPGRGTEVRLVVSMSMPMPATAP